MSIITFAVSVRRFSLTIFLTFWAGYEDSKENRVQLDWYFLSEIPPKAPLIDSKFSSFSVTSQFISPDFTWQEWLTDSTQASVARRFPSPFAYEPRPEKNNRTGLWTNREVRPTERNLSLIFISVDIIVIGIKFDNSSCKIKTTILQAIERIPQT